MKPISLFFLALFLLHCASPPPRIFYINSYHQGYGSSDDITAGIQETVATSGAELEIFYMDTKRQTSEQHIEAISAEALERIEHYKPNVIIASDDNAIKYIVAPHFKSGHIPVIFCGVNWSCEQYGLPTDNVTGMLEVLPLDEAFATLKEIYPDAKKLTILSENTTSEQNNKTYLDPVYREFGYDPQYALVDNYTDWKAAFLHANESADLIFFVTNGAIQNWDAEDAKAFITEHIKKPIFTADDFMMEYAVFGFTKVAKEQGIWAAERALEIINGASPRDFPVTKNQQAEIYINTLLAQKIGFEKPANLAVDFKPMNK
mgnify:FL=1